MKIIQIQEPVFFCLAFGSFAFGRMLGEAKVVNAAGAGVVWWMDFPEGLHSPHYTQRFSIQCHSFVIADK